MNDAERRIISEFVERVAGAGPAPAASAGPWGGSSVPATQSRPPLPPVDREADALIADLFSRYPEARYRITQTAFVQEAALIEAQNRIRQLEWEVQNAQGQAQTAQAQPRGLFGGMFGGGAARRAPMAPPPQPMYPNGYNPGMLGGGGSGFLGSALTTAAGVAGGMVLGNMLMGALSGHGGAAQAASFENSGGLGTGGGFGQEAVPTSSPWTDPGTAAGGWGGGGQDAAGSYDSAASYDDGGSFDDAGGSYDDDV